MNTIDLKKIRKSRGISQKELAHRLKISNCTLAHYESGIRKISLEIFLKIIDECSLEIKLVE